MDELRSAAKEFLQTVNPIAEIAFVWGQQHWRRRSYVGVVVRLKEGKLAAPRAQSGIAR